MDSLIKSEFPALLRGNARRPLLGLTILLVEDSRYVSEAVRLLCLRSGARLRRADSQASAYRHLATYRPSLVLVDIGLPDGSGLDIVQNLAAHRPNAPVILATSGDDKAICEPAAKKAGADGFLAKPLKNIREFQTAILECFPDRDIDMASKVVPIRAEVEPDSLAIGEDLKFARDLLKSAAGEGDQATLAYCAQFLHSVADACLDAGLVGVAQDLGACLEQDGSNGPKMHAIIKRLSAQMAKSAAI